MSEFCLSTVIYPSSEKYFDDFFGALKNIPEMTDATLVIINQGDIKIPDINFVGDVQIFDIDNAASIADTRCFMFEKTKTLKAHQHYVFSDIDDRLLQSSFKEHKAALKEADFSYGDMHLYDETLKNKLDKMFFGISEVPLSLNDFDDVMNAHFTGLSELAMNKAALDHVPDQFPQNIIFLDYWLVCALLNEGMTGARAGAILDYRLNDNSLKALHKANNIEDIESKAAQVLKILQMFGQNQTVRLRINSLNSLCDRLQNDPQSVLLALENAVPNQILWFQDVFILADHFQNDISKD